MRLMRSRSADALMGTHTGEGELQEQLLFHGSSPATIDTIIKKGFETRVSKRVSAMGAGTYFAYSSDYSDEYSAKARAGSEPPPDVALGTGHD